MINNVSGVLNGLVNGRREPGGVLYPRDISNHFGWAYKWGGLYPSEIDISGFIQAFRNKAMKLTSSNTKRCFLF